MKIRCVTGPEPRRDGEYPVGIMVGYKYNGIKVATIEEVQENLGTYGITWFIGKDEGGSVICKMNASSVVVVDYFVEEERG